MMTEQLTSTVHSVLPVAQVRPWRKGRQRGLEIVGLGGDGDGDDDAGGAGGDQSFGWWPFGSRSGAAGEEPDEVAEEGAGRI